MIGKNPMMQYQMEQRIANVPAWSEPEIFDPTVAMDRRMMYSRLVMGEATVRRRVHEIADDLFEMRNPDRKLDADARARFVEPLAKQGDNYGNWAYFPWSNELVQYSKREEHQELLAFRNRELITRDEQRKLALATVAFVGLSVGSNVLEQTARMGMGGKVILADPDVVSLPNLNRINGGMTHVGMRKTDVAGIRLSELNPYVEQVHLQDGLNEKTAEKILQAKPQIVFEHADRLSTKVLTRKIAARAASALIMATDVGDTSLIDIERHDRETRSFFNGRLTQEELDALEAERVAPGEQMRLIVSKIVGLEHISERMGRSLGQIGISLGGFPQLGTTAAAGAAYAAVAGREIILDRGPASGRYVLSPTNIFKS